MKITIEVEDPYKPNREFYVDTETVQLAMHRCGAKTYEDFFKNAIKKAYGMSKEEIAKETIKNLELLTK
jgi:hypothetical protein